MPTFLLRPAPPRPSFPFDATEAEKAFFSEHAASWIARAGEGRAITVGPVFEPGDGSTPGKTWGLALGEAEAEDEASAVALGEADPVIAAPAGFACASAPVPSLILRQP